MSARERAARRAVHALLARVRGGTIALAEDGDARTFGTPAGQPPLHARIEVRSPRFHTALLTGGGAGAGRAYMDGLWNCDDLVALVRIAARAMPAPRPLARAAAAADGAVAARRMAPAREHADALAGADRRPLRPRQPPLLALPRRDDDVLRGDLRAPGRDAARGAAREARPHLPAPAARARRAPAGDRHGLGRSRAARRRPLRLRTSRRRRSRASSTLTRPPRCGRPGWRTASSVLLQDYRDLRGRYDKLVSVEMIEAVGWEHLDTYFAACSELLDAARRDAAAGDRPSAPRIPRREGVDRLHQRVRLSRAARCRRWPRSSARSRAAPICATSRSTTSRPTTRARSRCWRERFHLAWPELRTLGYDERFRRMWDLYLAYCEAGFLERRISDVQLLLAKPAYRAEAVSPAPLPGRSAALGRRAGQLARSTAARSRAGPTRARRLTGPAPEDGHVFVLVDEHDGFADARVLRGSSCRSRGPWR